MTTGIEWTDETWNPVTGCSKVSPGCAHCYAETMALTRLVGRRGYPGLPWTPENAEANVMLRPERLAVPLGWKKPRRVFVNSMSDLFHELVPDDYIAKVFAVMAMAPRHTFQVLTKRPERMRAWVNAVAYPPDLGWLTHDGTAPRAYGGTGEVIPDQHGWPLPNVWLGTSVENQRWADIRIPELLATPAAVRFLSCEPLLGPVDLRAFLWREVTAEHPEMGEVLTAVPRNDIHWIIAGGESGPHARPVDPLWVRMVRNAAITSGTAFFFKQWGGTRPGGDAVLDGQEWREFPPAAA